MLLPFFFPSLQYILVKGIPMLSWEFLTDIPRDMGRSGGISSSIVGTLVVTAVAVIVATPFGIGTAIYLTEYTREGKNHPYYPFQRRISCGDSFYCLWTFRIYLFCDLLKYGLVNIVRWINYGDYDSANDYTYIGRVHPYSSPAIQGSRLFSGLDEITDNNQDGTSISPSWYCKWSNIKYRQMCC